MIGAPPDRVRPPSPHPRPRAWLAAGLLAALLGLTGRAQATEQPFPGPDEATQPTADAPVALPDLPQPGRWLSGEPGGLLAVALLSVAPALRPLGGDTPAPLTTPVALSAPTVSGLAFRSGA